MENDREKGGKEGDKCEWGERESTRWSELTFICLVCNHGAGGESGEKQEPPRSPLRHHFHRGKSPKQDGEKRAELSTALLKVQLAQTRRTDFTAEGWQ